MHLSKTLLAGLLGATLGLYAVAGSAEVLVFEFTGTVGPNPEDATGIWAGKQGAAVRGYYSYESDLKDVSSGPETDVFLADRPQGNGEGWGLTVTVDGVTRSTLDNAQPEGRLHHKLELSDLETLDRYAYEAVPISDFPGDDAAVLLLEDETPPMGPDGLPIGAVELTDLPPRSAPDPLLFDRKTGSYTAYLPNAVTGQAASRTEEGHISFTLTGVLAVPKTTVAINVRPWSRKNRVVPEINPRLPVAILGSAELDVTDVDLESLRFGPAAAGLDAHRPARTMDVDRDGYLDYLLFFRIADTGIVCGDTDAVLEGALRDGTTFAGSDMIHTIGCAPQACLHSAGDLEIGAGSTIRGSASAGGSLELGAASRVRAHLQAAEGISLRWRSVVRGDVGSAEGVRIGQGVRIRGDIEEYAEIELPPLATREVAAGGEDVEVAQGRREVLAAGDYGAVVVRARGRLILEGGGDYNFASLTLDPGARLRMVDNELGGTTVNVAGDVELADRSRVRSAGEASIYTNDSDGLRIGNDARVDADLLAPAASLRIHARTRINGCVAAASARLGPAVTINE